MSKYRVKFEKRGPARYVSHLDMMEVWRRSFSRADMELGYTEGFHPHPVMNIILPLPTGYESVCELLDIDLAFEPDENFIDRICAVLPEGVRALSVAPSVRPGKEIAWARYEIACEGAPEAEKVDELFLRPELVMLKKTKRGQSETDILKLIRNFSVEKSTDGLKIDVCVAAGNNNLNPQYVVGAIDRYISPVEYASYLRLDVLDADMKPFC